MVDGVLMWSGKDPALTQNRTKTRQTEDNNKGGGPSLPSNHSFKFKTKER